MATSTPVRKAQRTLIWLAVLFATLIGVNAIGATWFGGSWVPKLALDLEGGTEVILAPKLESGQSVSAEQLDQAVSIIRQRVDAAGVSEAEITTQGGQNIVVAIPGEMDEETRRRIEASARLEFRPVLAATVSATPTSTPTPDLSDVPEVAPTDASDLNWITPALEDEFLHYDCAAADNTETGQAPQDKPIIACEPDSGAKYILGPVEVTGDMIVDAGSGIRTNQQGISTGQYAVNIRFNDEGTNKFREVTTRLYGYPQGDVRNMFAIVLDGKVISAPTTQAVITDGRPEISGSFTQDSAKTLADQLKFGALPMSFTVQSQDTISATLGTTQLVSGLIAGLIGLGLVVLYSLLQYRLLGTVTIASLVVAAALTYLVILILSWRMGYRLSLAGVAGLIVAIGITADSFIVYFERIRDELRDGRALDSAIQSGWRRALRTITASDAINFLAAAVLFILAVGSVRGFALTLGLTTLIDLLVVIMFTHPLLTLMGKWPVFRDGHPISGLDPRALGAVYRGRAQFRAPAPTVSKSKRQSASAEAARRQTIAERKAAELSAGSQTLVLERAEEANVTVESTTESTAVSGTSSPTPAAERTGSPVPPRAKAKSKPRSTKGGKR